MFLAFRSLIAGPSPVNIKVTGRASQVGSTNSFRIYARNLDPLSQRIDEGKEKRAVQLEEKQRQQKERKTNERAELRERQRSVRVREHVQPIPFKPQTNSHTSANHKTNLSLFRRKTKFSREKWEQETR